MTDSKQAQVDKEAEKKAKQDASDVETFLAAHRGERLLRGENGAFDLVSYEEGLRNERLVAEAASD